MLNIFCFALATESASPGTSFVIVEPAAVNARFPMCTGATRLVLQPMNA